MTQRVSSNRPFSFQTAGDIGYFPTDELALEWKILRKLYSNSHARIYIVRCFDGWKQPGVTGSPQRANFSQPATPVVDGRALRHTALVYLRPIKKPSQSFHTPYTGPSAMQAIKFSDDTDRYHGDISIGNMGFETTPDCGGVPIKLHEFDLSKHHTSSSSPHCGTGSLPFMSIDLLENPKAPPRIGFDVESLLWTLLWIVQVYRNGEDKRVARDHPLSDRFANRHKPETIAAAKIGYLHKICGFTNEFYRELEWEMSDLAYQWHRMQDSQLKERPEQLNGSLLSESLHGMPGFIKIQSWMENNEWNKPRDPRSGGGEEPV